MLENPCHIDSFDIFYNYILNDNVSHYLKVYAEEDIQELFKSIVKYDAMIVLAYGSEHYMALAYYFDIPIIQVSLLVNNHITLNH